MNRLIDPTSKKAGETRTIVVAFTDKLRGIEALAGTPTAEEVGTSDLTITDVALTTEDKTIRGQTIPTLKAVQFSVSGGTAREDYTIRVTATGDTSPIQTLIEDMRLHVV
jgi:hypothetical protein